MLTAEMKLHTLLWQFWLMVGPDWQQMRWLLEHIVGITTDMGVERLMVDKKDQLPSFFKMIKRPHCKVPHAQDWTFPWAVLVGGWRHIWDTVLRRGCCSWAWFPVWLRRLKHLCRFFRNNKEAVALQLKTAQLPGLSSMLEQASFPNFAEWRWGTLLDCAAVIDGFFLSLRGRINWTEFSKSKEPQQVSDAKEAFQDSAWYRQLRLVIWLSRWVTENQNWIGGCRCHEEQLLAGEEVECWMKGRRICEASDKIKQEIASALSECNSWRAPDFDGDVPLLVEATGCARMVVALAQEKFSWVSKVPYILARLGEPNIRDEALRQFASVPLDRHHRISVLFLEESGSLGRAVRSMSADGTGMTSELALAVRGLSLIAMDDAKGEEPHARANREGKHARRASWPYVAASLRLAENQIDLNSLPGALALDKQRLWNDYKSVIQVGKKMRSVKCKRQQLYQRVYLPRFERALDDTADEPEEKGDDFRPGGHKPETRKVKLEVNQKMVKEFLVDVLQPYDYFSAPDPSEDRFHMRFFQVLSVDRKNINVKVFDESDDSGFILGRQRLEIHSRHEDEAGNESYSAFAIADPGPEDFLAQPHVVALPKKMLRWSLREATPVEGCICLEKPAALQTKRSLTDSRVPTLCLVWELVKLRLKPTRELIVHKRGTEDKRFDCRSVRRGYFQFLLAMNSVWEAAPGIDEVRSDATAAFFDLLLRHPHAVVPGRPAAEYQQLLKDLGEVDVKFKVERTVAAEEDPMVAAVRHIEACGIAPDCGSDEEILPGPRPVRARSVSSPSGSETPREAEAPDPAALLAGDEGAPAPAVPDAPAIVPEFIYGKKVTVERAGVGSGLRIRCCNPEHTHCRKFASLNKYRAQLGPSCAKDVLSCWQHSADRVPVHEHRTWNPSLAEVREYLSSP